MKVFACIFSFYILTLTALPCIDATNVDLSQQIEISQNCADTHNNDIDLCSPFCTCNCCVSPIITQGFIVQNFHLPLSQACHSDYITTSISSPLTSIWQPPKI